MKKGSFNYDELISCANGELFGPGNAKLPLPPMLMFDRITEISENKGTLKKGLLKGDRFLRFDLLLVFCFEFSKPCLDPNTDLSLQNKKNATAAKTII